MYIFIYIYPCTYKGILTNREKSTYSQTHTEACKCTYKNIQKYIQVDKKTPLHIPINTKYNKHTSPLLLCKKTHTNTDIYIFKYGFTYTQAHTNKQVVIDIET